MAAEADPATSSDEPSELDEDEDTLADGEWPVADQYHVEPRDTEGTIVVQQGVVDERRRRRFPPDVSPGLLAVLVAALLLIPAALAAAFLVDEDEPSATAGTTTSPAETTPAVGPSATPAIEVVPDVGGTPLAEARTRLAAAGFRVQAQVEASERPEGEVLQQMPRAGAEAEREAVVRLTVSGGAPRIVVPDVEGMQVDEAGRAVRRVGLPPEIRLVGSDEPAGTVLDQTPAADEEVGPDTVVRLQVAKAAREPATIDVPDVVGQTVADARARLRDLGLRSTVTRVESAEPRGTVLGQSPAAGAGVRDGATVRLRVSAGPAQASVPDVTGLDEQSARQQLQAAGFEVEVLDEPTDDPARDDVVVAQDPSGGARAEKGALVTLTVARLG
jgi:serine/threonine-protein kinase